MNPFRFLIILYFILQSAYCIRIIYREASRNNNDTWFKNADWFNISLPDRCSSDTTEEIETQCAKYGAEECPSNLPCSCTCRTSNATLAFYGDKWRCTSYAEMKNRVRCRYNFNKENTSNHIVYLPTTDGYEKAVIFITGTNGSCNIGISSSKYFTCNARWSPITGLNGTTNSTFYLNHYFGDIYDLKVNYNEAARLRGKLIKMGINCNPAGGDGEPCVMFKLRGYTDCGQNRSRATSCGVNTSPISPSKPPLTVSYSILTQIQTSLQIAPTSVHLFTSSVMPNKDNASLDTRKESSPDTTVIAAAAGGGGAFVIFLICTIIICCRRKRRSGERQDQKRNIFENQEEYEQNTNGHYNMTSLAYEDVDTAIDEKGKNNPTLHADAEDKNVAPELPPCIYLVNESSQGGIPDERPYDEVADTLETNILKLTNCTPSHAEYSEPEIPRFSSKSAKEMVLNKNDTEHYEQVEPKKNFCRDSLMAKVASTGAPQLQNTGYDIPEGIPDDDRSITLPNKPPIDKNNDIADKKDVNIQDKLRTHAVREPFYDEVEEKPPIIPSIEGYDVPETVIANESFNNNDDQRIIENAQENSQKLNAPEQFYDEVEQTPQDLPTGRTEIEGYDVPESIISEENCRGYIADHYASGIQNISQNPETQEPFYDQVEENPRVLAPRHPHIEGYDVPESIIAEENNKPTFFKVL